MTPARSAGRRRRHFVRALVALIASALVAIPSGAGHASSDRTVTSPSSVDPSQPSTWECSADSLNLDGNRVELAPVVSSERKEDGSAIAPSPDTRGKWVPVILVHGWTSRSTHPDADGTSDTRGAFSESIDLTANRVGTAEVGRSLVGQLQDLPGASVWTYDYHPYSGRWVTDDHLGPGLVKVIDCLAQASGEKVILIGHSMGGLVARYAAADGAAEGRDQVSNTVTLGTPVAGSDTAQILTAALDGVASTQGAAFVLRLLLAACGDATALDMSASGTMCSQVPFIDAFYSQAGGALRAGSTKLEELAQMSRDVPVTALAGSSRFSVLKLGWFMQPYNEVVDLGDIVVGSDSATALSSESEMVSCAYQLNAVRGASDTLGQMLRLTPVSEVAQQPLAAFVGSCFHNNLMRSIELTNTVMGLVVDEIAVRGAGDRTPEPSGSAADVVACDEELLRHATYSTGERPFEGHEEERGYLFEVHHCSNGWALVESQLMGASAQNIWLMRDTGGQWSIEGFSSRFVYEASLDDPLFTPESVGGSLGPHIDPDEVEAALGATTDNYGQTIFGP